MFYLNGYHLLFGDLDRSAVMSDIIAWLISKETVILSRYEINFPEVDQPIEIDCLSYIKLRLPEKYLIGSIIAKPVYFN